MSRQRTDVIVVGGGLSGLAAAATAVAGGATTLVLEAHQPGDGARTVTRDGFRYNLGPHALYVGGETHCGRKRIGHLIRRQGLVGVQARRKWRKGKPGEAKAPDLMKRDFDPTGPDQV